MFMVLHEPYLWPKVQSSGEYGSLENVFAYSSGCGSTEVDVANGPPQHALAAARGTGEWFRNWDWRSEWDSNPRYDFPSIHRTAYSRRLDVTAPPVIGPTADKSNRSPRFRTKSLIKISDIEKL